MLDIIKNNGLVIREMLLERVVCLQLNGLVLKLLL